MNRKKDLAVIIFVLTALVVIFAATYIAMQDVQRSTHLARSKSVDVAMSTISNSLHISFDSKWARNRGISNRIATLDSPTPEELFRTLTAIRTESGVDFRVVDENGICYNADGTSEYRKDIRSASPYRESMRLHRAEDDPADGTIIYITPLRTSYTIRDAKPMYGVLMEPMSTFQPHFEAIAFGEGCLSFIVDDKGSFLYTSHSDDPMARSGNFFSYLREHVSFLKEESAEQVQNEIKNGINNTALVKYNGAHYYLAYCDVNLSDWTSVMLVPEANINDSEDYTQKIFWDITGVFVAVLILFVVGFSYSWRQSVAKQKLAVEAERRSNEAKTNFLSSMSHDIRTPMNAIIGLTEIGLRHGDDAARMRSSLEKIRISSRHLLTLVNDILDIGKIESGKMPLNIAEFSIVDSTSNMIALTRAQAKAKGLDFRAHTHHFEQEYLLGDELRLNQIGINLITNAIKYTPTGGRVDVDIWEDPLPDDYNKVAITFAVQDTGIGMSEEFQKSMYDPFSRATDSRVNIVAGSGLGLAICKQIIQLMGGTMSCKSSPGEGTTFTVKVVLERGRPDEEYKLPDMRVLVVDHDSTSTRALANICRRLGITADIISSAADLEFGIDRPYQAAFVELGAPDNVGLAIARAVRKRFGSKLPIILTDIWEMAEYADEIVAAGIKHTMNKPYFYRPIYQTLQALIRNEEHHGGAAIDRAVERSVAGMNVLVAEDNDLNWEILCELLQMNGVTAERAENGQRCVELLENAKEGRYEAVLMDIRMPIMDGRQATRLLRRSEKEWLRGIPIIAMTADAFAEDIHECLAAGMDAHISKPINVNKLIATLFNLVNRSPGRGAAQ